MKSGDIADFLCWECAMEGGLRACAGLSIPTFAACTAVTAAPESPALDHVTVARKFGWMAIAPFMDNIEQSDARATSGLDIFVDETTIDALMSATIASWKHHECPRPTFH